MSRLDRALVSLRKEEVIMSQALVSKREQARALVREGVPYNKVVSTLGVAKSSVSLWCRDIRRTTAKRVKPSLDTSQNIKTSTKISDETKDHIRTLCRSGIPRTEIATRMGLHISTIQKICRGVSPTIKPEPKQKALLGEKGQYPYQDWHLYFSKDKYDAKVVHMVHAETRERLGMRYARYLMSVHLKRVLTRKEMVRYKDGIDDRIDNLILTTLEAELESRCKDRMRPCERCGEEFEAKRARTKYCSNKCKWATNDERKASPRTCRSCGTEFSSETRSQRYCSKECKAKVTTKKRVRTKTTKTLPRIECVVCEGLFIPDSPEREVCYAQYCNDVIKAHEE